MESRMKKNKMKNIAGRFHVFFTMSTRKEKVSYITLILLVLVITISYLLFSLNDIRTNKETRALELANSTAALIFTEYVIEKEEEHLNGDLTVSPFEEALVQFVEATDKVYYAFILKYIDKEVQIISDSAPTEVIGTQQDLSDFVVESQESIYQAFIDKRAVITPVINSVSGSWVHVLTPVYYPGEQLYAVLGFSYSATEWHNNIYRQMLPNILIILMVWALVFSSISIRSRQKQLLRYTAELKESERSKSLYLSQIAGMAYRCKNDQHWTMEFVSQGCYDLTGYQPEGLLNNKEISFNALILAEHQDVLRQEWNRILSRHLHFTAEYQIITKSGEIKWVIEYGQGVYAEDGSVEALEGIIFDITDRKKNEMQLNYLQEHDILTGLYNRAYMEQELMRFNYKKFLPLTVMLCDIDGLRMINSAYGYNMGNRVISEGAKLIKIYASKDAIVGRVGGSEFMLILPNTDNEAARQIKTDIKSGIQKFNLTNKLVSCKINVSIGFESRETMDETIEKTIMSADEALKKHQLLNQNSSYSAITSSIMATLYAKSHETEEHGVRLGKLATAIGEKMGLNLNELDDLRLLGQLHDIGKIGVNDQILNKPGPLTKEEWDMMKQHPQIGFEIVSATPQLAHIADYILTHHEHWNGEGYPTGLAGKKIPLISRILAVADAYDAMIEDRVYRRALTREDALNEIKGGSGTQFDPEVVAVLVQLVEQEKLNF